MNLIRWLRSENERTGTPNYVGIALLSLLALGLFTIESLPVWQAMIKAKAFSCSVVLNPRQGVTVVRNSLPMFEVSACILMAAAICLTMSIYSWIKDVRE